MMAERTDFYGSNTPKCPKSPCSFQKTACSFHSFEPILSKRAKKKSPANPLVYRTFWRRVRDSNPRFLLGTQHFESSCQNRTWRNLTEDNGRCENPENAVFSRLSAPLCIENAVKIRVRESPPISPSSNGFSEKPIRIFDRTERFFAPKSRFWQCVKSTGYAELHQKSCRKMPGRNQNCRYRQKYM